MKLQFDSVSYAENFAIPIELFRTARQCNILSFDVGLKEIIPVLLVFLMYNVI